MEKTLRVSVRETQFLNGAFFFSDFEAMDKYIVNKNPLQEGTFLRIEELTSQDEVIELPNKIYTSEVNNPFFFPLSGINTIGTGEIKGICSAVKALSEGQFGQFPLYAFTDEGVWALEFQTQVHTLHDNQSLVIFV